MVEDTLSDINMYKQAGSFLVGLTAGAVIRTGDEIIYDEKRSQGFFESLGYGFVTSVSRDVVEEVSKDYGILQNEGISPDVYAAHSVGLATGWKAVENFSELWE